MDFNTENSYLIIFVFWNYKVNVLIIILINAVILNLIYLFKEDLCNISVYFYKIFIFLFVNKWNE